EELHVIVDRAVPGPPLPVPNIDLVPDDPGVDPTPIPLGQATHELAPVILGVVPAEIEVARHAVRRAVGARPAGSVQDDGRQLPAPSELVVDVGIAVGGELIEVAGAPRLERAPPENEPG